MAGPTSTNYTPVHTQTISDVIKDVRPNDQAFVNRQIQVDYNGKSGQVQALHTKFDAGTQLSPKTNLANKENGAAYVKHAVNNYFQKYDFSPNIGNGKTMGDLVFDRLGLNRGSKSLIKDTDLSKIRQEARALIKIMQGPPPPPPPMSPPPTRSQQPLQQQPNNPPNQLDPNSIPPTRQRNQVFNAGPMPSPSNPPSNIQHGHQVQPQLDPNSIPQTRQRNQVFNAGPMPQQPPNQPANVQGGNNDPQIQQPVQQQQNAPNPPSFHSDVRSRIITSTELIKEMGTKPSKKSTDYQQAARYLKDYHSTIGGAKIGRTPEQRGLEITKLSHMLDEVKEKAQDFIANAGSKTTIEQITAMKDLVAMVDKEKELLASLKNDVGLNSGPRLTIRQALEFKRAGVPFSENASIDALRDTNVRSSKKLGKGAFNTVYRVSYKGIKAPQVIKPLVAQESAARSAAAQETGIPADNPRYGARNIATSKINDKLGLNAAPKAQYAMHDQHLAVAMDLAKGVDATKAAKLYGADKLRQNPEVQQGLNDLEWLDAVCGQVDRHGGNYMISIENGKAQVVGIDNDIAFGKDYKNPEDNFKAKTGPMKGWFCTHTTGLPSLISRPLADKIKSLDFDTDIAPDLKDLLSPDEISAAKLQFTAVKDRVIELDQGIGGHVLEDFSAPKELGGQSVIEHLESQPKRHGFHFSQDVPRSYLVRDFSGK